MIDRIATSLAQETGYPKDVLVYSLSILWNTIAGYAALVVVASLFGWLDVALILSLTYSGLRIFSGGAHASSNWRCIAISTIILNMLALTTITLYSILLSHSIYFVLFVFSLGSVLVYIYAPADVPEKPIASRKQQSTLKKYSVIFLLVWVSSILIFKESFNELLVLASAIGLLWQSYSLTPYGYKTVSILDKSLKLSIFRG